MFSRTAFLLPVSLLFLLPIALQAAPSAEEVDRLLREEPMTLANWPAWKARMLEWLNDRGSATDKAYDAARRFMTEQGGPDAVLKPPLADDYLAWYLLSSGVASHRDPKKKADIEALLKTEERCLQESIKRNENFSRSYRNLARIRLDQDRIANTTNRTFEVRKLLTKAATLDPECPLDWERGQMAMNEKQFGQAITHFRKVAAERPDSPEIAIQLMIAMLAASETGQVQHRDLREFADRFPNSGQIALLHGMGLAVNNRFKEALVEFDRAQSLGVDPRAGLPPGVYNQIVQAAQPTWEDRIWQAAHVMLWFVIIYAGVMIAMMVVGFLLALRTRGSGALELLDAHPSQMVHGGQIARHAGETLLARLYSLFLVLGLILFYVAIPFIVFGLLGMTAGLLLAIFAMGRIPIKLVAIVVIVGLGGAWAVFKSLFSRPASGAFGLLKTSDDIPELARVSEEVAQRINTQAVDQIYIAPGSAIGVHQEGRGPFGIFGVKKRVLTLGMSTMPFLTVDELKSILAHEYAHFSHSDTLFNRFIYQVHLSIASALDGMAATGGFFNYVNPFYWFLIAYYKCYSMLSAGYSRSREFLADRMACALYGSDVFTKALEKVCTDGQLFEMTVYGEIRALLSQEKSFVNMYEAFRDFRTNRLPPQEREEAYCKLLDEKGSLFASHPTFAERVEAASALPPGDRVDTRPALSLFSNAEALEQELTVFMTDYMAYIQYLENQAAMQQ